MMLVLLYLSTLSLHLHFIWLLPVTRARLRGLSQK